MNIYEIDSKLEELLNGAIDPETGELVIDDEQISALVMERNAKIENLAMYIKNKKAYAADLKAEADELNKRRKAAEQNASRAEDYLFEVLGGEKFTSVRAAITFRKSQKVDVKPEFYDWAERNAPELLRFKAPEADKTAIKNRAKLGEVITGVEIIDTLSMTIK